MKWTTTMTATMMASTALSGSMTISMFLNSMGERITNILFGIMTGPEKIKAVQKELGGDVRQKRTLAGSIRTKMLMLKDPATATLEPLEAKRHKRAKLISLGAQYVDKPRKKAELGKITLQIRNLETLIGADEATYETLEGAYQVALASYREALAAFEYVKNHGSAILDAIEANRQAADLKEAAAEQGSVDISFMTALQSELNESSARLRSLDELEKDLDETNGFSVDAELDAMDAKVEDEALFEEFRTAKA